MKSCVVRAVPLTLLCLVLFSCAELGISYPTGPGNSSNSRGQSSGTVQASVSITVGDARRLAVTNGLTGRRSLPPGIARNLRRGRPLPPGIARQMVPQGMLNSLPGTPDHEWRIAGRDLVLIAVGTAIVVNILSDVFE